MRLTFPIVSVVLLLAAASADLLPLARGVFVAAPTPCRGAPNSDIISYWGGNNGLNVAQAECTIRRAGHVGPEWTVARRCRSVQGEDLGSDTVKLRIVDARTFVLDNIRYRLCGMKVQF